jgi:hypothetical protein
MTRTGISTYVGQAPFKHTALSTISAPGPDGTVENPTSYTELPNEKAHLHPVGRQSLKD